MNNKTMKTSYDKIIKFSYLQQEYQAINCGISHTFKPGFIHPMITLRTEIVPKIVFLILKKNIDFDEWQKEVNISINIYKKFTKSTLIKSFKRRLKSRRVKWTFKSLIKFLG